MELHQISYFLALETHGSFTAAAEASNVSQPSLSAQILKLEEELGGALFERSRKGSSLTTLGRLFLPRAREIHHQIDLIQKEARQHQLMRKGTVQLGCLPTTGAFLLPPLLREYRRRFPEVDIRLTEGSSPSLAEALRNREIEIAIMDEAGLGPGIEGELLFSEPLYLAMPPGHPLGEEDGDAIDLSRVAGHGLILMRSTHGFFRIVTSFLRQAGVQPNIIYQSSEIETVQALVKAGLGISIVPRMICHHRDIVYRRIRNPEPTRSLFLSRRESYKPTPAVRRFSEIARRMRSSEGEIYLE